ncbi:MAG: response regulator transcription factor [Anaerolineae bacterium]|jgi:DNA-binding response OmpR family regulator|nr:response regulator transcription factor [Chloroflexota bacterium]
MNERILIVDDEPEIVRVLRGYLERANYTVLTASSGPEALRRARTEAPDLILLDVMLPGMDGIDVCRTLRQSSNVPIIMVTARVEETDRILGLELGADDYVTKPFSPREVVARVRALLRRSQGGLPQEQSLHVVGDLQLDVARHTLRRGEQLIDLTPSEFEILRTLMAAPGHVFTRLQLLEAAQGQAWEGYERTIDTHVKNLRHKIEPEPSQPCYILTVHGIGYKLWEG